MVTTRSVGSFHLNVGFAGIDETASGKSQSYVDPLVFDAMERFYPIGNPGEPWGDTEKCEWFETQTIQRSYSGDVVARIEALDPDVFQTAQYGRLTIDAQRYRLLAVTMRSTNPDAPWVLITGGVHGYETSGVHGALAFLEEHAAGYQERVNVLVAPCVSPWGYETINRWNPFAVDPNRSFGPAPETSSPSEEAAFVMGLVAASNVEWLVHIDLHETTDTDESEFRPALAARDGERFEPGTIPDGFYTVGDTDNPQPDFQAAIIAGVEPVTHIAPADGNAQLIGADVTQHGVINYPLQQLGLCPAMTDARFTTTTEVYPDSVNATDAVCIAAQVAAVRAGLDYALARNQE